MSKVFITGDCHGDPNNLINIQIEHMNYNFTKDDYVIVCGDFGFIWKGNNQYEEYWLDWINKLPWTTLFVDGNHENFTLLNSYPVVEWHGGRVHKIKDSVLHLMRGEVFEINNEKFFCFGGANSSDQIYRVPYKSWWPEEEPSKEEYNLATKNLEVINFQPDYIITHEMPYMYIKEFYGPRAGKGTKTSYMLNDFLIQCYNYKKWFCGHHHADIAVRPDFQICYKKIYEVGDIE